MSALFNKENVRLFFAIATGILRNRRSRRALLCGVVLVALLMTLSGTFLIASWLAANALAFLLYWCLCILLTFFSMLLAVHDLLMVAREARSERERLKADLFDRHDPEDKG